MTCHKELLCTTLTVRYASILYRLLYNVAPLSGPQLDFSNVWGVWNMPNVLYGRLAWQLAHPSTGNVTCDTTATVSTHASFRC
jgi:hypothetical protein